MFSNQDAAQTVGAKPPQHYPAPARALSGTIRPSRESGLALKNAFTVAVQSPTESGLLLCPNSRAGRALCAAASLLFGLGALVRKTGGVTSVAFLTPSPPHARKNAKGGFSTPEGAENHA